MCDDIYAYRLRVTRNYSKPEMRFDTLISALPIHASARLDDSMGPHSALHSAERLSALLAEALGRDDAINVLKEAMIGQPVERNLGPLVSADARRRLGESDF